MRGLISIGTNSTRLLVVDGKIIVGVQSTGTRLGRGLGTDGNLHSEARDLTLATIRSYADELYAYGARVDVIATSALRRANDAGAFGAAVAQIVGLSPRVLSGDEEARYSFDGAVYGSRATGRLGVLDVGGGSTELAVGTPAAIERTISLEIGAVRLAELHPALLGARALDHPEREEVIARAQADADRALAPLQTFEPFDELLAVGGTVFTLAAMLTADPSRDGVHIKTNQLTTAIDELLGRNLAARRGMPHIRPQRADILPAGLIVVKTACERLGLSALRVSHSDLLAGYLRSPAFRAVVLPARTG